MVHKWQKNYTTYENKLYIHKFRDVFNIAYDIFSHLCHYLSDRYRYAFNVRMLIYIKS